MVKKILLSLVLYCFYSLGVIAQTHDNHGMDTKWFKGRIVLNDGTELAGFIRNNEKGNIISYKENYDAKTFESFRAVNILTLEYFDQDHEAIRRFYSLISMDKADGTEDVYLFEILREFEHFAVLSLLGRSKDHHTTDTSPLSVASGIPSIPAIMGETGFSQTEEIFFMNEDGERELYMTVEHRDVEYEFFKYKTDKGKVDDPLLPSRYMSNNEWTEIKTYIKSAHLKVDNREKLLVLLDYYATLIDH